MSWEGTDRQQNLSRRSPAAEREALQELLPGMRKWEEGRTRVKAAVFTQEMSAGHPRRSPIGMRALWKAGLALNEVFMCAPGFTFSCWSLITVGRKL